MTIERAIIIVYEFIFHLIHKKNRRPCNTSIENHNYLQILGVIAAVQNNVE